MLNDLSSPLALLRTRRSGRPRDLGEPGPSGDELQQIVSVAARTPDHGKLAPWRFIHVPRDRRDELQRLLESAYRVGNPAPGRLELEAIEKFAQQAPTLIVVLFTPVQPSKIPLWEQQLSCGAAVMNLELAAHAMGYAAGWVTGWAADSEPVLEAFGGRIGDRIAGFIYIGTPLLPLEERVRPDRNIVFRDWEGLGE